MANNEEKRKKERRKEKIRKQEEKRERKKENYGSRTTTLILPIHIIVGQGVFCESYRRQVWWGVFFLYSVLTPFFPFLVLKKIHHHSFMTADLLFGKIAHS